MWGLVQGRPPCFPSNHLLSYISASATSPLASAETALAQTLSHASTGRPCFVGLIRLEECLATSRDLDSCKTLRFPLDLRDETRQATVNCLATPRHRIYPGPYALAGLFWRPLAYHSTTQTVPARPGPQDARSSTATPSAFAPRWMRLCPSYL